MTTLAVNGVDHMGYSDLPLLDLCMTEQTGR